MCGRFTLTSIDGLVEEFGTLVLPADLRPRYNIAPTQAVPIIANENRGAVELVRWGLIPHWAKDASIGNRMINARSETLASKPAFRAAFTRRRCLVLADGFYEWRRTGKAKVPYFIRRASRRPFSFAGLWERWKAPDETDVRSCTIVTTEADELIAPLHDRMPVIVLPEDRARWLAPDPVTSDEVADILRPAPLEDLELFEVSPLVNSPANDSPECIAPAIQPRLFD